MLYHLAQFMSVISTADLERGSFALISKVGEADESLIGCLAQSLTADIMPASSGREYRGGQRHSGFRSQNAGTPGPYRLVGHPPPIA